tara:strand:+ start:367 stop:735 length:369 start_codon:yes stop_codon:yes gene_type:complete
MENELVGRKILVVDDSPSIRRTAKIFLEEFGADVAAASTSFEALAIIADFCPDSMLIDESMPRFNAYDFSALLGRINRYSKIRLISLSSRSDRTDPAKIKKNGFWSSVSKPFTKEDLYLVIH